MVDNAPAEKAAESAAPAPSSKKFLFIGIGAAALVVVAVVLVFFTGIISFGHKAAPDADEAQAAPVEGKAPPVKRPAVGMKEFVVNLADTEQTRYLKVNIELEVTSPAIGLACDANQAAIRSSLVELLSSKTYAEIRDIKGKAKLRQEVIVRLNEIIGTNGITQVYFTDFIVQ